MIQFTINSFSHGLTGRPYNSIKDAIQDGGSYSVWCNEKIKLAFSFGNGTEKDFKRYCKDNKCKIVSEAAYDFANEMKETATIRGYFVFKHRGQWQTNTVFIDHVFK